MKWIYALAIIPCVALLFSPLWANYVTPYILGLPFLLFWIIFWTLMSSIFMAIIYKLDGNNKINGEK